MNWKLYCLVSGSQCDQFQYPASSASSSISRAGMRKAMVSYGSAATLKMMLQIYRELRIKATHYEVLIGFVWRFSLLLPCAHKPPSRNHTCLDLRQVHLHHHTFLTSVSIPNFGDSITWSPYLQENFPLDVALGRCNHQLGLLEIPRSTPREVGLMFFSLCMSEVGPLIGVQGETKTTF